MSNIGSVFHITANDAQALNWDEKLPNGYKAHAVGITTLKVFKEHLSLVISRDDFDAMMSFLITYGKTPIKLNCKEFG